MTLQRTTLRYIWNLIQRDVDTADPIHTMVRHEAERDLGKLCAAEAQYGDTGDLAGLFSATEVAQ